MKMQEADVIAAFAALSQETRLRMLRVLVRAGDKGMAAGSVSEAVGASSSNASFHLAHLERAGLVTSERDSRSIIYRPNFPVISALGAFLMHDCCRG